MNTWFKKIIMFSISVLLISIVNLPVLPYKAEAKCTYVSGYTKKDGTRVSGYYRGCGSSNSTSSSDSFTTTYYSDNNNYYGSSRIVNLYKGKNFVGKTDSDKLVYVKSYYRKDGTFVRPHYRTYPNSYLNDNFSYLGVSSLTPKEKYPNFIYSNDKNTALKEKYLLYNLLDYNLNDKQLATLKTYTNLLNEAETDKQKEQFAINVGTQFYKDIGYDETNAISSSKFDLTGAITLEDYLFNVANNINPLFKKTVGDIPVLETYATLLKEARNDPVKLNIAQKYGTKFYKLIGAPTWTIENQLEMDKLQPFDTVTNNNSLSPNTQLTSINDYSLSYNVVRNYLVGVGASHNIVFSFDVILDSISYQVDLELLYGGSEYFLNSSLTEGIKFYTKYGLSNEEAKNQTFKDINVILAS